MARLLARATRDILVAVVDSVVQRVAVVLEYPVVFTRGVFDVDNAALADTLSRREPGRRHRFVAIIDRGVAAAWPLLAGDIEAYAQHHADRLELAAPPWTIPGGETAKCDEVLSELHRELAALHIDRHSFVVAIGGGAMLDVVGYAAATLHRAFDLVQNIVELPERVALRRITEIFIQHLLDLAQAALHFTSECGHCLTLLRFAGHVVHPGHRLRWLVTGDDRQQPCGHGVRALGKTLRQATDLIQRVFDE